MSAPTLITLSETYRALWQRMSILDARKGEASNAAARCLAGKARYQAVANALGLPYATGWVFIALTHYRESNNNFHCHLHNGDPLTARTTHVPAGRPAVGEPPFTWEESAEDALRQRGLHELAAELASLEGMAYATEGFNGWGYFWHNHPSAYLWAGTSVCPAGKYVQDGVYDPAKVDPQMGTMPLLQLLMAQDPSIRFGAPTGAQRAPVTAPPAAPVVAPAAPVVADDPGPKTSPESSQGQGSLVHTLTVLVSSLTGMATAIGQAFDVIRPYLSQPAVVAAIVAALAGMGIVIWREHHKVAG